MKARGRLPRLVTLLGVYALDFEGKAKCEGGEGVKHDETWETPPFNSGLATVEENTCIVVYGKGSAQTRIGPRNLITNSHIPRPRLRENIGNTSSLILIINNLGSIPYFLR
jgi:hypothetical protein